MTTSVEAVSEKGVLRPLEPLKLAEGSRVSIVLEPLEARLIAMREAMSDHFSSPTWKRQRRISSMSTRRRLVPSGHIARRCFNEPVTKTNSMRRTTWREGLKK